MPRARIPSVCPGKSGSSRRSARGARRAATPVAGDGGPSRTAGCRQEHSMQRKCRDRAGRADFRVSLPANALNYAHSRGRVISRARTGLSAM